MFSTIEITTATGGRTVGRCDGSVSGISTDSRTVAAGELFVPLRGERFDGHDFIASFAAAGGKVTLAEESWLAGNVVPGSICCIAVQDTLRALGDLAAAYRKRFAIPLIGITGSNGKTTTKEMLATIMAVTGEGLKTSGNLNNLIGLPHMLFRLTPDHRWGVLEMGMSEFGEIDRLAEITAPGIGIITNAYPAHLASLGSVAGVARAKGELFLRLPPGGTAVYNADDPLIAACRTAAGVARVGFGLHGAEVTASGVKSLGKEGQAFTLELFGARAEVMLRAFGSHNVYNALAAAAAANAAGIQLDDIVAGLSAFTPYDKRFKLEDLGVIVLIDDSYNANPASVGAALLTLRELKGEKRGIAVLGDMLELGSESETAHQDVGHLAGTCVDRLYLYGEMARTAAAAALEAGMPADEVVIAESREEIVADIIRDHLDGDYIMVKGSRGMRMDLVASALRENFASREYAGGRA
ncbi:MAG TPA: UDP-N-acetylmuramoyl-tripeptide--D-alanyl-D-alanine ligase [Geobacteraceae bacterium]|nr:UDP-N-acetylmuramoyl-tripeptide--D-alanyl-D-alanine ligase [Geobacteraceae bacterium]